jgi:purine catabolism regulator
MGLTILQALKLDGLRDGHVLTGKNSLERQIEFVDIIETPIGTDWDIKGGLFLTTFYAIKDDINEQLRTIDILNSGGCSVLVFQICVMDKLPQEVIDYAEKIGFPIIVIPREVTYPTLIQPLVGAILKEEAVLLQRSDEINRHLMNICVEGGGIDAIISALGNLLNRPVLVLDAWGGIVSSTRDDSMIGFEPKSLDTEMLNKKIHATPVYLPAFNSWFMKFLIGKNHELDGYLVINDSSLTLSSLDLIAVERASVAIILEILKRRAVIEMERSIRRDFMENLLALENLKIGNIAERAHSLGWDFKDKHIVVLFELNGESDPDPYESKLASDYPKKGKALFFDHALVLLNSQNPSAILTEQGNNIVFIPQCPTPQKDPSCRGMIQELVASLRLLLGKINPDSAVRVGIGGFYEKAEGLLQSFKEAKTALVVSRKLALASDVTWYDDIMLYSMLERLASQPETISWIRHSIGDLLEYDEKKGTEHIKTLETYLSCGQHIKETAYLLNIHPKTLRYRLDRIRKLLKIDLFQGEQQLIFYLACKMLRLIDFSQNG